MAFDVLDMIFISVYTIHQHRGVDKTSQGNIRSATFDNLVNSLYIHTTLSCASLFVVLSVILQHV